MYLWAALFSGTVIWLSFAKTQLFVLAVATMGAVLVLLLMSMPRLRWWRRKPGGQRAQHAGQRPVTGEPRPQLAAGDSRPGPGVPARPG